MPGNDDNPGNIHVLIGRKVEQLDHFISDVLSHSKNLKQDITIELVDSAEFAGTFTDLSYLRTSEVIKTEIEREGADFYCDRWNCRCFRNLISNAIKVSKDGHRTAYGIKSQSASTRRSKISFRDTALV